MIISILLVCGIVTSRLLILGSLIIGEGIAQKLIGAGIFFGLAYSTFSGTYHMILGGLAIVVLVVGGGYSIYQYFQKSKKSGEPQE